MKELTDSLDLDLEEYTKAEHLTEITITPKQHHLNVRVQIMNDLMGELHKVALMGINKYRAPFHKATTTPQLIDETQETLNKLGYKTSREYVNTGKEEFDAIIIEWEAPSES